MKRSLRALAAVAGGALLLAGCATGETGHLDPEIEPDLMEVRSSPNSDGASGNAQDAEPVATPAPGTSAAPSNAVEAQFAATSNGETWYASVEGVDVDQEAILVTTRLEPGDPDAVAVCEAAFDAASATGINSPSVDVRSLDGDSISQRDTVAGDQGCSSVES